MWRIKQGLRREKFRFESDGQTDQAQVQVLSCAFAAAAKKYCDKNGCFSFLECGINCDTKMPCNAYYFDNGICSLSFLKKNLFYNVQDQDEENKSIYLNGKYC